MKDAVNSLASEPVYETGGDGCGSYAERAQRHRPTDPAALTRAVLELSRQGLTAGDIGYALRLSADAVRSLLQRDCGGCDE